MNRRVFLKLTGIVAVAGAVAAVPAAARWRPGAGTAGQAALFETSSVPAGIQLTIREPGTYRISGQVRLDQSVVEISGITHTQRISWSDAAATERPLAGFTTFEQFDRSSMTRTITVRGGHLEGVTAVPLDFA